MLKKVVLLLALWVVMLALTGCETKTPVENGGTERQDKIYNCFDTYEELDAWFAKDENENAPAMEEMGVHGERYEEFVLDILTGEQGVAKPYWGDAKMQLQNKEGFTNISIDCIDGRRPWIWYHCRLEGVQCTIRMTYLTQADLEELETKTLEEVVISTPSLYEKTTESMMLRNQTVSAIVGYARNDDRIYIKFVYDQIFVQISMDENVFENVNWQEFSIRTE